MPSSVAFVVIVLVSASSAAANRLLRSGLPHHIDPRHEVPSALQHIEDIADPVEDIELRQRPPHVLPEEINKGEGLMAADLADLLGEDRDSMSDCVVIHQYAEPLQVGDAVREQDLLLSRGSGEGGGLPPLVRQGAVWDDSERSGSVPLAIEMFAHLQGITGMVQVVPHGPVAKWTSKEKVPIGGFLCSHSNQSVSAPVLHATPTPCIPTALDRSGTALNPVEDGYEVFIGTTRVRFDTKASANKFCLEYARKIASDMSTTVWDASSLGELLPQKNPSVASFVAMTGKLTSPQGWTRGRKKLLVVVMDWKAGDRTLSPYSAQDSDPIPHYKSVIFPAVNRAFERMSYGQFGVDVTFVPEVIRYSRDRNRYTARKMPFPALYDAARDSLEGQRGDYKFDAYDLVYVIAPQVKPTGTKGVAWVGAKGAMCNGCETISDKFKIMVAVHELGHNLGLMHASSTSLEYGNPFDWMGNYPDVVGLNYGLGYVWSLGWLTSDVVYTVGDQDLSGLSVAVVITPHDTQAKPQPGQVAGVRVSLSGNARDLWVSFRSSPEGHRSGVFLVQQDKDEANSELIDAACHSPSQQDASLRVGWVYLDPSHRVAVKVLEVTEFAAKIHLFEARAEDVPKIYGQPTFTDGETKCPVTCQDANWLVTAYNCPALKKQGYCKGGSITLQGNKYAIGHDICPQECGQCDAVMKNTPLKVEGGCQDRNIKISGKDCGQVARAGWCGYETKGGSSVGKDLCPASCGQCPKSVAPSSAPFTAPKPTKTVGAGGGAPTAPSPPPSPPPPPPPPPAQGDQQGDEDEGGDEDDGEDGEDGEGAGRGCTDDPNWSDKEGDTCADYAKVIGDGRWTQSRACNYNGGAAKLFCRRTCNTCTPSSNNCADSTCIATFKEVTGRCEQCADWSRFCTGKTAAWFKNECPLTCGLCSPSSLATERAPISSVSSVEAARPAKGRAGSCADDGCIAAWRTADRCPTCSEMGPSFCSEAVFASACRKTCRLCLDGAVEGACKDVFSGFTCGRYRKYGWCVQGGMREAVSKQCPLTCGVCTPAGQNGTRGAGARENRSAGAEDGEGGRGDGEDEDGGKGGRENITYKAGTKTKTVFGWPPVRGSSSPFSTAAPQHRLQAVALLLLLGQGLAR